MLGWFEWTGTDLSIDLDSGILNTGCLKLIRRTNHLVDSTLVGISWSDVAGMTWAPIRQWMRLIQMMGAQPAFMHSSDVG